MVWQVFRFFVRQCAAGSSSAAATAVKEEPVAAQDGEAPAPAAVDEQDDAFFGLSPGLIGKVRVGWLLASR